MTYKTLRFIVLLPLRILMTPLALIIFFILAENFEEFKELLGKIWE